jgi:glycosyltransferase involved in cell wall biosynthesis
MQTETSSRPSLAVTLPVYNDAAVLPRALDALVRQSRLPDQLIVMDDGSTDSTWEVIQDYAGRYPFIQPIRNLRNEGVEQSTSLMLPLVRCTYLLCTAADDLVLPGFFESAMRLAEAHPQAGIIFGAVDVRLSDGSGRQNYPPFLRTTADDGQYATPERVLDEWVRASPVLLSFTQANIYQFEAFKSVGGYQIDLGPYADTFANHAIALKTGAAYIPELCAVCNVSSGGYWARTAKNYPLVMGIVDHAVRLMKSPEFNDRFPRDYVGWWSSEYRRPLVFSETQLLLHHAKRFWVHAARLCFVPNGRILALRMIMKRVAEEIGNTWRKRRRFSK